MAGGEYSPDGAFPEDGPLASAGVKLTRAHVLKPTRPGGWFARFAELYREHGPAPARPELAGAFAERLGLSPAEAAVLLTAYVPCAPYQLDEEDDYLSGHYSTDLEPWKIRQKEAEQAVAALTSALGSPFFTTLTTNSFPTIPSSCGPKAPTWTGPPSGGWRNWAALCPYPPRSCRSPSRRHSRPRARRPSRGSGAGAPRAGGPTCGYPPSSAASPPPAHCLAPHRAGLVGEPQLPALPRIAAWLAYRTPAGDPLRPAVGAAISRLCEERAPAPGPLTLLSLQSNYLMGPPPSNEALTAHPAKFAHQAGAVARHRPAPAHARPAGHGRLRAERAGPPATPAAAPNPCYGHWRRTSSRAARRPRRRVGWPSPCERSPTGWNASTS